MVVETVEAGKTLLQRRAQGLNDFSREFEQNLGGSESVNEFHPAFVELVGTLKGKIVGGVERVVS